MTADRRLARWTEWMGARAPRLIAASGAAMLAIYLAAVLGVPKPGGRIIAGDAVHPFVQLRSIVFDRDLDFRNEYAYLRGSHDLPADGDSVLTEVTVTGHIGTYEPVGPALLWAPLYIVVAGAEVILAWLGLAPFPNGFERTLQLVPGVTGVLAATMSTYVSWRIAARLTDRATAAIAALAAWFGSQALYYSLVSPAYSHSASMLTAALFFSVWLAGRDRPSIARFALWGGLAGLSALMRWQDALFLVVPILDALAWRAGWPAKIAAAAAAVAGAAVAFSPQMVVWTVLYGQPLAIPQGPSFLQWGSPHLFAVLFSNIRGLYSWTPLLLLATAGLILWLVRRGAPLAPVAAVVLLSWYVNAAVADWWAGEAFGARRFLSLFPLFVIGLAVWIRPDTRPVWQRPGRVAVVAVLVVLNGLLLFQYELAMKGATAIAPFPGGWFDLYVVRFLVPIRFAAKWLHRVGGP